MNRSYAVLAAIILCLHLAWILWVILGAIWTRGRSLLAALHILSLLWGVAVEAGPWPCPLTALEQYFETGTGGGAYQGGFVVHYLDRLVYPDVPDWTLTVAGVAVCVLNLAIYVRRWLRGRRAA